MFTDDLEVFSGVEGDTLAPLEFTEMFIEGRDEFDEVDNWDKKKAPIRNVSLEMFIYLLGDSVTKISPKFIFILFKNIF